MAGRRAVLLLSAALLGAAACASGGRGFDPLGKVAEVSEDDERSLGAQVDQAIQAQIPLIDDPVVIGFVNELGQRVVAGIEPQPFVYRFRVIPNSTLNAFALPGGYLYFHSATILEAATVNELAGVMGHEIAHVKAHHYARGTEKTFWPSLLARAAGIAAAVATGEPGFAAAAEGANVALQLKYSREFETEADELGAVFVSRAGFDPSGMGRFFERIVAAEIPGGLHIPPYLYSHPDLEKRIDGVKQRATTLRVTGAPDPELEASFRDAQARLARLLELGRTSLQGTPPHDRTRSDPLLARANALASDGQLEEALRMLREAERQEPGDPRLPFRRGELLEANGRTRAAIAAWRRSVALDPSVALAYYHLGNACKAVGDRHDAAYYFEQAERRFKPGGPFQRRAQLALQTLSYPPVSAAGLADGKSAEGASTVAGGAREAFAAGDGEFVWWAQVDSRYGGMRKHVTVRWSDPSGATVQEGLAQTLPKSHVAARLPLAGPLRERFGVWRVEAVLGGQVIDRRSFAYEPALRPSNEPAP
jgi:predicted Zn-dependent protease